MLVELEITERDNDSTVSYKGNISETDFDSLIDGTFSKPFIQLQNVFWTYSKKKENEWEESKKELKKYGQGDQSNYQGDMYIRVDNIFYIHPLKEVANNDGTK